MPKLNDNYSNKTAFAYICVIAIVSFIITIANLGFTKTFAGEDYGLGYDYPEIPITTSYYTWDSLTDTGKTSVTSTISLLWNSFLYALPKLGLTSIFIERLVFFLYFAVSGTGFFLLTTLLIKVNYKSNQSHLSFLSAFIGSLLYALNHFHIKTAGYVFSGYLLTFILLPWVFYLFIYNLHIKFSLLNAFLFSLTFLLFLSGNPANTLTTLLIFSIYFLIFRKEIKKNSLNYKNFFLITFLMIILLSSYTILPILGTDSNPYGEVPTTDNLISSLQFNSNFTSFLNLFRSGGSVPLIDRPFYDLYTSNTAYLIVGYLIPLLAFFTYFAKNAIKIKFFCGLTFIVFLFFSKGSHVPFSSLMPYLFSNFPILGAYRAVYAKFFFFAVFTLSILISFFFFELVSFFKKDQQKKYVKLISLIGVILICIYSMPFFTGRIIYKDLLTVIPDDYKTLKHYISNKLDSKTLALPPAPRGAGLILRWDNDNMYYGPHPDVYFLHKPVIDSYWFIKKGFYNLDTLDSWVGIQFEANFNSALPYCKILSIKYLLLHKDFVDSYDFGSGGGKHKIDGKLKSETIESILKQHEEIKIVKISKFYTLYKLSDEYSLPHIYTVPFDSMFFINHLAGLPYMHKSNPLKIEFKKTNPTKYLIRIHQANEIFPLIFAESFHDNWKAYLVNSQKLENRSLKIDNYKILDGNEEDQASLKELKQFIANGWISTLGDLKEKRIQHKKWQGGKERLDYAEKYHIDFISKNLHGTIQNNNLPDGPFYETWFAKKISSQQSGASNLLGLNHNAYQIPDENHLMANGYANGWIIDAEKLCKDNPLCIKNPDGSYDFEVIIEFWPQRLFYLGLFISGMTLICCIGYLAYDFIEKRKAARIA